jgi:methionyl-tRNA formyltransferase
VDNGPIIGQKEVPIYFEDTIATLYERVEEAGLNLLGQHLSKVAKGQATYSPQDEERRRIVPQRSPEDGKIDWGWPARRIYNFVRAQTRPYSGAFTFWEREKVTIWKASLPNLEDPSEHPPGTVLDDMRSPREAFGVRCGDGQLLWVHEVGLPDARSVSGREFLAGRVLPGRFLRAGI